jgi:diguanylate cyclase
MSAVPEIKALSLDDSVPEDRRRRVYLMASALGLSSMVVFWFLRQGVDVYVRWAYPFFLLNGLICAVMLSRKNVRVRVSEWYTLVVFVLIVLSKFIYEVYAKTPSQVSSAELTESVYWLACIVVLMIYMVLETRRGLYAALLLVATMLAIGSPGLVSEALSGNPSRLIGFARFLTFMAGVVPFVYVISSVKERLAIERWHSSTDVLTGAANRRKLLDVLHTVQRGCAVILFDLDHFKQINDTFGHEIGDAVLRDVAALSREVLRSNKGDTIGRWGGEEFLVVLPGVMLEQALEVAERLRYSLAAHGFGSVGQVTASFGVAYSTESGEMLELIRQADEAMYRAKQGGRNQVVGPGSLDDSAPVEHRRSDHGRTPTQV